jgi:hypothetical protein
MAAHLLRGEHRYTTTLRVAGFAQSAQFLLLLEFIPGFGSIMRFLAIVLTIFGVWMGVATANDLKGWRTIILPLLYLVVMVVAVGFLAAAIVGATYTWNVLLQSLGLVAP